MQNIDSQNNNFRDGSIIVKTFPGSYSELHIANSQFSFILTKNQYSGNWYHYNYDENAPDAGEGIPTGNYDVVTGSQKVGEVTIRSLDFAIVDIDTCQDGMLNGDETGIDCGGSCQISVAEDCNGLDDNRNCQVDEDIADIDCSALFSGICSVGTATCSNGNWEGCPAPLPEECNNEDDDCDGSIDNELDEAQSCGLGICSGGVSERSCDHGIWSIWSSCSTESLAVAETCNGLDDDCDGILDGSESLSQQCGITDVGLCTYGTETCDDSGNWVGCDAVFPAEEIYDNEFDEDCNGINEENPSYKITSPTEGNYSDRRFPFNISLEEESDIFYIDLSDRRPRARRLCRDCEEYGSERAKTQSFSDGNHSLNIYSSDGVMNETFFFIVDSKEPRISRIEPRNRGYCTGLFSVKYSEDNPEHVYLHINEETIDWTHCEGGRNEECEGFYPLDQYEGETITFSFSIQDLFWTEKYRKDYECTVDTTPPHIIDDQLWVDGRYIHFNVSLDAENDIMYIDNAERRPRERRLCGNCEDYGLDRDRKKSFRSGFHNITLIAEDDAGNRDYSEEFIFTI